MDILNLILAGNGINGLKASGGIGYTETQSASFTIPLTGDVLPDVTLMNMGWKWFSNLTPTQEEFLDGVLSLKNYKGEVISSHSISTPGLNASVVATATGAYCIRLEIGVFIVSNVLENELGTLPKTGMYYFTGMVAEDTRGGTFVFDFPNKVHPIDPKYIPEELKPVIMDCDAMGITETLGKLLVAGGGEAYVETDNHALHEEFWNKTLQNQNVLIKANVSGLVSYFTPSFVETDEDRIYRICADVYVDVNGMQKCFVQFTYGSKSGNVTTYVRLTVLGAVG